MEKISMDYKQQTWEVNDQVFTMSKHSHDVKPLIKSQSKTYLGTCNKYRTPEESGQNKYSDHTCTCS